MYDKNYKIIENISHNETNIIKKMTFNLNYFFEIPQNMQTENIVIFAIKHSSIDYMLNLEDCTNSKKENYNKVTLRKIYKNINKNLLNNSNIINCITDKYPMNPKYLDLDTYIFQR